METWALIDTETDGLYAPIFAIEVAAQKFEGLKPVGSPFRVFINHGIDIPLEATAVHGYTTEFIVQNGLPPLEAYSPLREYSIVYKLSQSVSRLFVLGDSRVAPSQNI